MNVGLLSQYVWPENVKFHWACLSFQLFVSVVLLSPKSKHKCLLSQTHTKGTENSARTCFVQHYKGLVSWKIGQQWFFIWESTHHVSSLNPSQGKFFDFLENIIALFIVTMDDDTGNELASDSGYGIEISNDLTEIFGLNLLVEVQFLSDRFFNFSDNIFAELEISG